MLLLTAACVGDAEPASGRLEAAEPRPVLENAPAPPSVGLDSTLLAEAIERAAALPRLRTLLVARHGEIVVERRFRGPELAAPANVKSVSKSVISALVGIALEEGALRDVDQPIAPFFPRYLGGDADPLKRRITIGNLLSMQSGLERTSGGNYGAWVSSPNWVRYALARPMVEEPGGPMLYSTGNTHLLSAILTEATEVSTLAYARGRLFEPMGIPLRPWPTDPQGIYFGGNDMRLTPREMLRFGELYRNGGRYNGKQIVPAEWIRESWTPRTRSRWSGQQYGYGWFIRESQGHPVYFAWGYGGQFIFVIPELELTVVTTSNPNAARDRDHTGAIHRLLDEGIIPAAERGSQPQTLSAAAPSGRFGEPAQ